MDTPGAMSRFMPTVPLVSVSVGTGLFELLEQLTAAVAVSAARAKRVAFPKSLITMTSDGFRSIDADGAESPVRRAPLIKDRAKRRRSSAHRTIGWKSRT